MQDLLDLTRREAREKSAIFISEVAAQSVGYCEIEAPRRLLHLLFLSSTLSTANASGHLASPATEAAIRFVLRFLLFYLLCMIFLVLLIVHRSWMMEVALLVVPLSGG